MPYIPTNCYPRNTTIQRNSDGYTFLGNIDSHDLNKIRNVLINIYDNNKGKKIYSIDYQKGNIYDLNKMEYAVLENQLLQESLNISENGVIQAKIPFNLKSSEISTYDNLQSETLFDFENIKTYSRATYVKGSNYYDKAFTYVNNLAYLIQIPSVTQDVFLYIFAAYYPTTSTKYPLEYSSSNNLYTITPKSFTMTAFLYSDSIIAEDFSLFPNELRDFISNLGTSKQTLKLDNAQLSYYQTKKEEIFGDQDSFQFLNISFSFNSDNRVLYKGTEYIFSGSCSFDFSSFQGIPMLTINRISDGPYPYIRYISDCSYIDNASLNIENNLRCFNFYDFFSYIAVCDQLSWSFMIDSFYYDTFICETSIQNSLIEVPQQLSGIYQLNNSLYGKIDGEINKYIDFHEIAKIKKTYANNVYTYRISLLTSLQDIFQTTVLEIINKNLKECNFIIGTEQIQSYTTLEIEDLNTLKIVSSQSYGSEKNNDTLSSYVAITRYNLPIEVSYDTEFTEILSNYSGNVKVYASFIESYINTFNIVSPISHKIDIFINSLRQLQIQSNERISNYQVQIFLNNNLVFKSGKIFNSFIDFIWKNIMPNETYRIEILIDDLYTYSQILLPLNYTIDDSIMVRYETSKKAMRILLVNPTSLPYYDSETGEIFTNSLGEEWTKDFLSEYKDYTVNNIKATIYRYNLNNNNEIIEQHLIVDSLEIIPKLNHDLKTYSYNTSIYDYGVTDKMNYRYEVFYDMRLEQIIENDWLTKFIATNKQDMGHEDIFGDTQSIVFDKQTLRLYHLNGVLLPEPIRMKLYIDGNDNITSYWFDLEPDENNICWHYEWENPQYNDGSSPHLFIYALSDGQTIDPSNYPEMNYNDAVFQLVTEEDVSLTRSIKSITSPRLSDILKIDDWIGVCLYGTNYKYELSEQNRYELDPNQIWYFDLDTKADQIDFANERNIYTNLSSLPKVGISNVNYMTQSITTKLGYLNEDDMYVDDNGYKLNKFAEWAQDGSVKILRLRNGYLIPVDIQLKSNIGNYAVVGTPSDISFQWTQIGDHKTSVLYSVE